MTAHRTHPPARAMRENPDLDQLKRQARELLEAYRAGAPEARLEVAAHHRTATPATFALHDAQFVLARSYGFQSWPKLKAAVDAERDALKKTLFSRVNAFNQLAKPKGLRYPRYEGGFFVTVFRENAPEHAARMRERGVFVVPQKGALRVALCSAKEADVARLVDALAE